MESYNEFELEAISAVFEMPAYGDGAMERRCFSMKTLKILLECREDLESGIVEILS